MTNDEAAWELQHLKSRKEELDQGRETLAQAGMLLFDSDPIAHGIEQLIEQRAALLAACEAAIVAHDTITENEMDGYGACRFCGMSDYPVDADGNKCESTDAAEYHTDHTDGCVSATLDALSVHLRTAIAKARGE